MKTLRLHTAVFTSVCILSMMVFSACERQEENTSPDTKESAISVNFGNGEEVWSASYSEWVDYREEYNEVNLYLESQAEFPAVIGSVIPSGTTVFPDSWDENAYLFFEYYSNQWPLVGHTLRDPKNNVNYGDWQVDSGTVTITSISATLLSGKAELVMYNLYDFIVEGDETPRTKPLTVTFTDIPISSIAQFGAATRTTTGAAARRIPVN